jgi:hypothetical protein
LLPIIGTVLISVLGSVAAKLGTAAWNKMTSHSSQAASAGAAASAGPAASPGATGSFASVLQETGRTAPAASPALAMANAPGVRPMSAASVPAGQHLPGAGAPSPSAGVGQLATSPRTAAQAYARTSDEVQAP